MCLSVCLCKSMYFMNAEFVTILSKITINSTYDVYDAICIHYMYKLLCSKWPALLLLGYLAKFIYTQYNNNVLFSIPITFT